MLGRYFRTIRYLRPEQIRAQVWNRVRRAFEGRLPGHGATAPPLAEWRRSQLEGLESPAPLPEVSSLLSGVFTFAGKERQLGWPPNWSDVQAGKLWRYNLHYHEWLWSLIEGAEWDFALTAVVDWIDNYPIERGAVGWDPYPISLRLQNWAILLFRRHGDRLLASEHAAAIWASVWRQAVQLESHLERHLMGNHLLENAVTLVLLGATFAGEDGNRWRAKGMSLLERELVEQVLPDGMHFELSPMYHQRVHWLLTMLCALDDDEVSTVVSEVLDRVRSADGHLRHPDGENALLNDSALGVYATLALEMPAVGAWSLPDAGYFGYRSGDGDYLVCDAGKLGPDYLPGHAHADCLSFELSVNGQRIITDTGISDYEVSPARSYVRSTAAHNTVEIEGKDQAEMWAAFRVGARGYPREVAWEGRADGFSLEAAHSGYERLAARVTHWRRFEFRGRRLSILDRVRGRGNFEAIARFHLAPGCSIQDGERICWEGGEARICIEGPGELTFEESPYYERFGEMVMRTVVAYRVEADESAEWETTLNWEQS